MSPDKLSRTKCPGQKVPGQNVPGQNVPGQNVPGQNVPGQNVPGQNVPGQNVPDKMSPEKMSPYKMFLVKEQKIVVLKVHCQWRRVDFSKVVRGSSVPPPRKAAGVSSSLVKFCLCVCMIVVSSSLSH